jgi:hypothetical protein
MAGLLAAASMAAPAGQHDQVGQRDFFAASGAALKSFWMPSSTASTLASSAGLLASQSFCGARRMRAPLAPPRLSLPRKVAGRRPGRAHQAGGRQARGQHLGLERGHVLRIDQRMVHGGHRVLPDQFFLGTSGPR